jgi:uncharacterized repeat protein (TIGR01451 family)
MRRPTVGTGFDLTYTITAGNNGPDAATKVVVTDAVPAGSTLAPLTELENQVMEAVWNSGPSSVEAVHLAVLPKRPLKEATHRCQSRLE